MEDNKYSKIGYEMLAAAVVEQAAKDAKKYPQDVRHFFCDEGGMFDVFMPNSNGEAVYNRIMDNYEKYNSWQYVDPDKKKEDLIEDGEIDDLDEYEDDEFEEEMVEIAI